MLITLVNKLEIGDGNSFKNIHENQTVKLKEPLKGILLRRYLSSYKIKSEIRGKKMAV